MPKDLNHLPLEELRQRYDTLYREKFAPTLASYTEMAAEALALQIAIYRKRLAAELGVKVKTQPRVLVFSARESPAALNKMLITLQEQQVKVSEVIYDPARHEFHLFTKNPE